MMPTKTEQQGLIVKLTEENFDGLSSGGRPLFVDFWATWCGPCKAMDPVVERLAARYSDRVVFGKVNVDEEISISSRYDVYSIPTFMVFRDGHPMDTIIGAVSEPSLERLLRSVVGGFSRPA